MHTSLRHYSLDVERDATARRRARAGRGGHATRVQTHRKPGRRRSLRDLIWGAGLRSGGAAPTAA